MTEFTIIHATHIGLHLEMILYGKPLSICSQLTASNDDGFAGLYVALCISHLTILHARRAKTWRFGYLVFTSIVLFLDTTIVRSSFFFRHMLANCCVQHVGTDIASSTLAFAGIATTPTIASTASYSTMYQIRFVTNSIAVFTADLFLVRLFCVFVSSASLVSILM